MSGRQIPVYDMDSWSTTLDMDLAMMNGYIGECWLDRKLLSGAVHYALTGRHYPERILMFYFGKRDERLSGTFGYE